MIRCEGEAQEMLPKRVQQCYLEDCCIFCDKTKYKPNSKTRETLHGVQEFRAYETVRKCACLCIQQCTAMSVVAQKVIGLCAKDLIWCSETKYHASFYKASLRIQYTTGNTREGESSNDYDMTCNLRMIQ